ncbi:HET-domain-containing protein, partial [Lophiostoma macrostomum CBS 122681]
IRVVDVCARKLVPYTGEMEYVALSYVWGGKEQPTVRKDGPIPSELPLTIEHAMVVVKHLGYRFIWVDSVCIDQGDSGDQAEQIGLMHVIYSCATATLILLDSPHADSGIPGIYIKDGKTRPELPREGQLHVYLDKKKSIEVVEIPPPLSQALNRSMWSKRAWTYQEAVLSRRRIILTRHQLFWSCSEASFSE